jgi:hypothetical protein
MDLSLGLPALDEGDLLDSMENDLFDVPRTDNLHFAPPPVSSNIPGYGGVQQLASQQQTNPQNFLNPGAYWPNNNNMVAQQHHQQHQQHQQFQSGYGDAYAGTEFLNMPPPAAMNSNYLGMAPNSAIGIVPTTAPQASVVPTKVETNTTKATKPAAKRKTKAIAKSAMSGAASVGGDSVGSEETSGGTEDAPKQKRRREKLTPEERDARKKERLQQRRMKKSEREKLRRNRENQLFDELADLCALGKDNRDKSSILAAVITTIAEEGEGYDSNEQDDGDDATDGGGAFRGIKQESELPAQLAALLGGSSTDNNMNTSGSKEEKVGHTPTTYVNMAPPASTAQFGMPTMPPPQSVAPGAGYSSGGDQAAHQLSSQNYGQHQQHMMQHQQQGYGGHMGGEINNLMGPPAAMTPNASHMESSRQQLQIQMQHQMLGQQQQQRQQQQNTHHQTSFQQPPNTELSIVDRADMKEMFPIDEEEDNNNKFAPFGFGDLGPTDPSFMQP